MAMTIKNAIFWDVRTRYVSATEPSQLMLCQIWGFHACGYEECCLLGYKNPIRTSQETHYVSTTEPSQLILCKIWRFHDSDYEECCFLGHKTQLVPHKRHITSPQSPPRYCYVKFEVFTAVTVKNSVFWDVTPCSFCSRKGRSPFPKDLQPYGLCNGDVGCFLWGMALISKYESHSSDN
jgi:hypothetical protein